MTDKKINRREFVVDTAVAGASLTAVAGASLTAVPAVATAAQTTSFTSQWHNSPDRVWLGADYWANPMQDWRLAGRRIECINAAPNRNVHLLTRQTSEQLGTLFMSVRIGRVDGGKLNEGKGSAGFRFGINGPLREYRNSLIFGQGLDAGFTSEGKLFIDGPYTGTVDLAHEAVELRLTIQPIDLAIKEGQGNRLILTAHDLTGKELGQTSFEQIGSSGLAGNLALVANFATAGGAAAAQKGKKGKAKAANSAADAGAGTFWFADWKVSGSRVEVHEDQAFGPILFNHYTLSHGTLKMTAQLVPIGRLDPRTVRLEVQRNGQWTMLAEAPIHEAARTATFRIDDWDASQQVPYRLAYWPRREDRAATPHYWTGTIRRDPVDQPVLTVADVSCNIHEAFPNHQYTANMAKLNPDLIAFVGDQFYESTGGYGVQRAPLEPSILDYLRKWYMHGWTWRDLTRDRPSISIPDDHDVYQGNNWGEGGAPQTGTQEQGGYNMPAPWVNVVHQTQTSHHPDPWDATPGKQGITVYSGPLVYGRVSFAILADRQFKSAPEGKVPPTGSRGDHVVDPNWDPKTADLPGLQLLGPSQLKHLAAWVRDWRGAEMKAVISQTIFTGMATHHGGEGRLVADYDTNGWPQTERNAALREMRRAFAFHIAGDQHLPALIHYGIDQHNDAGLAFAGPAVNTGYPRWFEPLKPGENRAPGAPENTGQFRDSFGHPLTVLAVADGSHQPRTTVMEKLHDKVSGLGLVRFDKANRKITVECWPFLADPTQPNTQFRGWPATFDLLANFGRKAAAQLPRLTIRGIKVPLIEVLDDSNQLLYCLRLNITTWQPHVFAPGKYSIRISDPESGKAKELKGLNAEPNNTESVEVVV